MAESDVLKKEDVDEITDVLQVAPHQKNNQFSSVSKSESGDLVSLDELYEKTGQEAISRFINGFEELAKSGRLSRDHGLALNIQGAENWLLLPDEFNTRIGKESFLGAVKKGIVAIVKAIIAFIKGVSNWIYARVMALLGFSRTVKETKYLYDESERFRIHATAVLKSLGLTEFDRDEFLESVEKNLYFTEIFSLTKNRIDDNAKMFERLEEVQTYIANYAETINGWNRNLRNAKRGCDANISQLRRLLNQRNGIVENDILTVALSFSSITKENLNPERPLKYLTELVDLTYGIEIEGLGVQGSFVTLRNTLKDKVTQFKAEYNKETIEQAESVIRQLYKARFSNKRPVEVDKDIAHTLRGFVNDSDAQVISAVSTFIPGSQLEERYLEFCNSATRYAESIDVILNIIQRLESNVVNILKWKTDANMLMTAILTDDLIKVQEAIKTLSPEARKDLEPRADKLLIKIEQYFDSSEGTQRTYEVLSRSFHKIFSDPVGKELLLIHQRYKKRIMPR